VKKLLKQKEYFFWMRKLIVNKTKWLKQKNIF